MTSPCLYCGHPAEAVDHIVPRCRDGGDEPSNLAPACRSCNSAKAGRPVEHFLRDHPEVLARVRRYQAGEDVLAGLVPGVRPRSLDTRMATTLRIEPKKLEVLKVAAHRRGVRVNELVLTAIDEFMEAAVQSHP